MMNRYTTLCLVSLGGMLGLAGETQYLRADDKPAAASGVGAKVPNKSSLRDLRGNRRSLHDFKDHRALVLVFLGADCPISNRYVPSLLALEKKYRSKDAQFVAIYAREHEDLDRVAMHSYDRDIPFPVLKDFGQGLADALGVERVPSAVVLDKDFVLRYRGRIDDRYGVAASRQKATRDDLAEAIEDVLAGKQVRVAETEADGCLLDRAGKTPARKDITYTKHVASIMQRRCQACHRPDQAAPFSLLTYEDAVKHARMLKEVTTQRRMPPWHADSRYGKFANNRRLTDKEIETLTSWVDAGTPRGDDKDLPKPIAWTKGWTLGKPDLVLQMPEEFDVPADGVLDYQQFILDPGFKEDVWIEKAEARPGAASVVHHIIVYILPPGQDQPFDNKGNMNIVTGWAPGDLAVVSPPDTGLRIPKDSRLLFEMHYTPNGTAVKDRSSIGLILCKKKPKFEMLMNPFSNESILLPPREQHYRAEAAMRFRADARILSLVPHMHWRGKNYYYELVYPDGSKRTILSVPRWDFNWQNNYVFAEPIKVPKGTRLHTVAHWDNSRNNPYNPDPNKEVRFGLQTWDEMMVGWCMYTWEQPDTPEKLAHEKIDPALEWFDRLDRNCDNVLTPNEIPTGVKLTLKLQGIKIPDRVTYKDFQPVFDEMRKQFEKRRAEHEAKRKEKEKGKEKSKDKSKGKDKKSGS